MSDTPGQSPESGDEESADKRRGWRMRGRMQDLLLVEGATLSAEELESRVPGVMLVAELDTWLSSFLTRRMCLEMYEVVTGMGSSDLLINHRSLDLHRLKPRLARAFREGELMALALGEPRIKRAAGGGENAAPPPPDVPLLPDSASAAATTNPSNGASTTATGGSGAAQPSQSQQSAEEAQTQPALTWVAFELVDNDGKPLADARYKVILPDGEVREGSLDSNGYVRIDGIPKGAVKIFLPEMDEGSWQLAGAGSAPARFEEAPPSEEPAESEEPIEEEASVPVPVPDAGEDTDWVSFSLVDDDGKPLAGVRYRLTCANGEVREGTLDDQGSARIEGIPEGTAEVSFPELSDVEEAGSDDEAEQ